MDTEIERQKLDVDLALQEIVQRIADVYRPLQIYLFGSRARGTADPDSDYDLLVVVPDDAPPERRRSQLAYESLWSTGTAADVLVCTESWFRSRLGVVASL